MVVGNGHQKLAYGLTIGLTSLAGVLVILRGWSRLLAQKRLHSDDWLILIAYWMNVAQAVATCISVKLCYIGVHRWNIPPLSPEHVKNMNMWIFVNQVLYNPTLTFVKVSVLMFLRRIDNRNRVVVSLWWTSMILSVGLAISVLFTTVFQCTPVAFEWDKSIKGGHCIDAPLFFVLSAAINIFTDLLILVIPILITWPLQLAIRKKIAICVILCLGLVSTSVGSFRLWTIARMYYPNGHRTSDPTYSVAFTASCVEQSGAIMAACGPSLKALVSVYLPGLLGKSNGSQGDSGDPRRQFQRNSGYMRSDDQGQIEMGNLYARMRAQEKEDGVRCVESSVTADYGVRKDITAVTNSLGGHTHILRTTDLSISSYRA